ncbi:MAG: NAD(P)/FAD-dependent oxidoreductase [Ktedonobacterales bacterium]
MPTGLYDVAIVGAGPSGSASAIHLARSGFRVVLLDKAYFPRDKPCAEYLSPPVEHLLNEIGVRDELQICNPGRLRGFHIYAPNGDAFRANFSATRDARGQSYFETGLAVPRLVLDAALVQAAQAAGAELREGWRLAQLASRDRVWTLTPAGGDRGDPVRARLLLAADGVHSTVARRLGLHIPLRMRKVALVAHMRGVAGLDEYGEIHVAGRRYVGLAPLEPVDTGDLCNVALVVDEARDGSKLAGRPQEFLLESLTTFPGLRDRLGHVTVVRPTLTTSRLGVKAKRCSGDGLMLVGDAGGYYDPFTGEGIYRALRSAQFAGSVAGDALQDQDLSAAALARYDRLLAREFRGKRTVETIIQAAVQVPPLANHLAAVLKRKTGMADTIVAVTGDYLPSSVVLRPGFLLRLIM